MNEGLPRWRTFASDGPGQDGQKPEGTEATAAGGRSPRARAIALTLGILGACGVGAAVVAGAILLLTPDPAADLVGSPAEVMGTQLVGDAWGGDGAALTDLGQGFSGGGETDLVVDVAGAVQRPGLVRLREGDRVGDAIAAAGGFGPRVDLAQTGRSLNLAQSLDDGAKVVVPELGAQEPLGAAAQDGRVDLNSADQAALEDLPGIGPVTAMRIIEAREQQRFASVEELRSREVVGESVFEDIEDLVRASG